MSMFKVGDQVVDLRATGDYWPGEQGEVVAVDGSRIKVSYFSGETRWRKDISLAMETSREAGAKRFPPIRSLELGVIIDDSHALRHTAIRLTFERWGRHYTNVISTTFFAGSVSKASLKRFMRAQKKMIEEIVPETG